MVKEMEGKKSTIRTEVVRAITELVNDREARERIDKGILSHTKGREHWILHLLLRALETQQEHNEAGINYLLTTTNTVYKELSTKIEGLSKSIENLTPKVKASFEEIEQKNYEKISAIIEESFKKVQESLAKSISESIGSTAEAIKAQALETKNLTQALARDIADTFKITTQVRLLINENLRKLNEIGDAIGNASAEKTIDLKPLFNEIEAKMAQMGGFEERIEAMLKNVNKHIDLTAIDTQNKIENIMKAQLELSKRVETIERNLEGLRSAVESLKSILLEIKK